MKLYREVKTSERLPEMDTQCYTDVGFADYCGNDNWMVEYPEDGGFVFGQNVVKWWLEPIEITEEDIRKEMELTIDFLDRGGPGKSYAITRCAKAILSKLKGE